MNKSNSVKQAPSRGRCWSNLLTGFFIFSLLFVSLLTVQSAVAQTGIPFIPHQSWFLDSFGSGVFPLNSNTQIQVETDGVPGMNGADHTHPYPAEINSGLGWSRNYRLSPSRQWLYVFGNPSDSSPGVRIYLYRIPAADGAPLEPVVTGTTLSGIAFEGFFDQGSSSSQHLFFAVEFSGAVNQRIIWVDLDTGVTGVTSALNPNIMSPIYLAANGIAAFVHTDGVSPGLGTYHLVELCVDDLGTNINPTGSPFSDLPSPVAAAYLVDNSGSWEAGVWHGSTQLAAVALDDCSGAVVPDVGACCDTGNCIDNVTQDYCENQVLGTWQGSGSTCASTNCPPPPVPVLSLSISGPSIAPAGNTTPYSVMVVNAGAAPAVGLTVVANVPGNATFISASHGGVYAANSRTITWVAASLNDGNSLNFSFEVTPNCSATQLFMNNCSVFADNHSTVFGLGVITQITPLSTEPVSLSVGRVLPGGEPMHIGDSIEFTFTITNSENAPRNIKFNSSLGNPLVIDSFVDLAGGSETNNGAGFWWEGSIGALQTINVVVRGVVPACMSGGAMTSHLNDTWPIVVRNMCGSPLATLEPSYSTLIAQKPTNTHVDVGGVNPTTFIGGNNNGLFFGRPPSLVRKGAPISILWSLVNNGSTAQAISDGRLSLGGLVPVNDPPFVGTPPAGAVWDSVEGKVRWSGNLAAGDSLVIEVSMIYPESEMCSMNIYAQLASVDCDDLGQDLATLAGVGQPYTESHLVEMSRWGSLYRQRPGVDTDPDEWLCLFVEYMSSLSANEDGSFWMAGLPTVRFDPVNLQLEILGFFPDLDMQNLISVVEDTPAQVLYVLGYEWINGAARNRIRVIDLVTEQISDVFNEANTGFGMGLAGDIQLDQQGRLVMTSGLTGLFRMDPADSNSLEILSDNSVISAYAGMDLDSSGNYFAVDASAMDSGSVTNLVSIDSNTGVHQVLADLSPLMPVTTSGIASLAVGDSSRYYVSVPMNAVYEIDLSGSSPVVSNAMSCNFIHYTGLAFVAGTNVVSGVEEDEISEDLPQYSTFAGAAPNPFNPRTTLRFDLADAGKTILAIYDLQGRLVRTLISENLSAGHHEILWNGDDRSGRSVASGMYLARLQSGSIQQTVKLLLTR